MGEILGVLAAVLSSALGGSSIGATRFLAAVLDPITIGMFRFGVGFLFILPLALLSRSGWPSRRDLPAALLLGLCFCGLFPLLFNGALIFTTAARGALALSTLPLLTMAVAAALGVERLSARKLTGVLLATVGVTTALAAGLHDAPPGAWRGDLLMLAAALCMSFYNVWSRPFIRRSGPLQFTALGMGVGAACLTAAAWALGRFATLGDIATAHWLALGYLGAFGGALTYFLWIFALGRTTPTLVAISVTVNPLIAATVGTFLLNEPFGWHLALGLVAIASGIGLATTSVAVGRTPRPPEEAATVKSRTPPLRPADRPVSRVSGS